MDKRALRALQFSHVDIFDALDKDKRAKAASMLDQWLWDNPDDFIALYQLGRLFIDEGHPAFAKPIFEKALQLEPTQEVIWLAYGRCLDLLNDYEGALKAYKHSLKIKESAAVYANMATTYVNACDIKNTKKFAVKALELDPGAIEPKYALGWAQLYEKDYKNGWKNYYYGMGQQKQRQMRNFVGEPEWDGKPVKSLCVYGEQGIGDEICFASAYHEAEKQCENFYIETSPRLVKVLSRSFPKAKIYGTRFNSELDWDHKPELDASISGSGLFKYLRTNGFSGKPFLKADLAKANAIRAKYPKKPIIGLAWSGGLPATKRKARTLSLEALKPILSNDATFISLEYVDRRKECEGLNIHFQEEALSVEMDDVFSLIAACDLVISVPTTAVHVAGALGVPTLCLVHDQPSFFFGLEGESMDIWKSVRLYRGINADSIQRISRDIKQIFKEVA